MKQTTLLKGFTISALILAVMSCDPGHHGKTNINNGSSFALELKFKPTANTAYAKDTTYIILPNTSVSFYKFGGLGTGKDYDCCPCEFESLSLQPVDTSKSLIKDIKEMNNWLLTNPNSKRFNNKEINCEFTVTQSDIQ